MILVDVKDSLLCFESDTCSTSRRAIFACFCLDPHTYGHMGKEPCKCEARDAEKTARKKLMKYKHIHCGERPLMCEMSDAVFNRNDNR